jgi:hypothetical protein
MPRRCVHGPADQQVEARLESREYRVGRQGAHVRRGQFNGQWQSIQFDADRHHCLGIGRRKRKLRPRRLRALDEQADCRNGRQRVHIQPGREAGRRQG